MVDIDAEFSLLGEEPKLNPSAFDDFWAVITDMEHVTGEDEERKEFYRQVRFTLRLDAPIGDIGDVQESFNMPTDRKTGGPLLDENGAPSMPNQASKWGRFFEKIETLGVPWERKPSKLIGLHAHFQRKGERVTREDVAAGKRGPRGSVPYGRYVVEWDGYDNQIRSSRGLAAMIAGSPNPTTTMTQPDSVAAPLLDSLLELAQGKDFIQVLGAIRTGHRELAQYANRVEMDKLVADGLLKKVAVDGKEVYQLGE